MISLRRSRIYRHGDLSIRQVAKIPDNVIQLSPTIIAFGEKTGHNHQLVGQVQVYETPDKQIHFEAKQDVIVKHQEHNTLKIAKGNYVVIHEREYDPFKGIEQEVID